MGKKLLKGSYTDLKGLKSKRRTILSDRQKGLARTQPHSDHAKDCDRYKLYIKQIEHALQVIDSSDLDRVKRNRLSEMGFDPKSYDWIATDHGEARMRYGLYQELLIFRHAVKLLS